MSHALRTLRVHKKIENFADKNSQKNIKELKNRTQKNNKIADAVVFLVLFLFFMFYVTYVTGQNLHVYSQQYLPYTSVNSSSENLGFKSNNISNCYLSLPPPPPLPHLSAWNVLLLLEEVSFWSALRLKGLNKTNSFSCVTEVTRGKEKMHWIPNYCSFFHLSSCAIQSFGYSDLTLSLPCVTKTEFLLTISIHHQTGKWWEYRKISVREL